VKGLPLRDQPAFRVATNVDGCTLVELLAAVIGGVQQMEVAENLVLRYGDVHGLARAHVQDLANIKGIGNSTAVRIKAALGLSKEFLKPSQERVTIHCPADAAALVQHEMESLEQEQLRVILLDTRNRVIDVVMIYQGSLNSSQVRVGEIFKQAISRSAAALVVVHCHPSGDPSPSPDDIAVTRAIVQAGKLLDTECLDHLVIGNARFVSLKERGLAFDGSSYVKDDGMHDYLGEHLRGKCCDDLIHDHEMLVYGHPDYHRRSRECNNLNYADFVHDSRMREVNRVDIVNVDLHSVHPDDIRDNGSVCWWLAALDTADDARCPECEGAGRVLGKHGMQPCPTCEGKGEKPRESKRNETEN